MNHIRLTTPSSFCWNKACPDYGKVDQGNIVKFGKNPKGIQRYQCRTCKKAFVENKGTVFCGCHHSPKTILECLAMVAERNSLAAIHRVKGIKEETVLNWLLKAANQVEEIEDLLMANHKLTRVQLDAMWTFVGNKGKKRDIRKKPIVAVSGEELQ